MVTVPWWTYIAWHWVSHDTILMLLQNNDNALKTKTEPRSLQKHLSRREIVKVYKITWTVNDWSLQRDIPIVIIPSSFTQILSIDCSNTIGISDELYRLWVLFRHTKDPDRIQNFSSFASYSILWWRKSSYNACRLYPNYSTSCHRSQHHQYSYGDFSECLNQKRLDSTLG